MIKQCCTSDVCLTSLFLSVVYIGPKSRTERPRKTKIGREVAHVTRDSDTTFKVKRSKVNLQGRGILWRPPARLATIVMSCVAGRHSCDGATCPQRDGAQSARVFSLLRRADHSQVTGSAQRPRQRGTRKFVLMLLFGQWRPGP